MCTPPSGSAIPGAGSVCIEETLCKQLGGEAFASSQGAVGCAQFSTSTKCCNKSPIAPSAAQGRCVLPTRTFRGYQYVHVEVRDGSCANQRGWMSWSATLVPLDALGLGATEEHCAPGARLPNCAFTAALQAGGWPSSLLAKATCTIKHESGGNPAAMAANNNGKRSVDLGLMQVNTGFGHCATCDMRAEDSLCGVFCWELTDAVKAATCAKKIYDCSPNKFGAWYGYGAGQCKNVAPNNYYATDDTCVVPQGARGGSGVPPEVEPPVPIATNSVVEPSQCPPWLDCTKLSVLCRTLHTLPVLSSHAFHANPPPECRPLGDEECGAACAQPPALVTSQPCTMDLQTRYDGECQPIAQCTNHGLAYVRNGECTTVKTDYCCAKVSCVPPQYDVENPFAYEILEQSQCAHRDYCTAAGGTPYPSTRNYKNACSAHPSAYVVCCTFPTDVVHSVWTGTDFIAYREDEPDVLPIDAASLRLSLALALLLGALSSL